MERQFATFYLGEDLFGIDILMIDEINRNLEITPIEQAPEYVRGLMNLRGQIVTVLDLGVRLNIGPREIDGQSRCIVLKKSADLKHLQNQGRLGDDTANDVVGLLVDRVGDMTAVDDADIESPPANVGGIDGKYLSGIVKMENQLMVTLRTKEVLARTN